MKPEKLWWRNADWTDCMWYYYQLYLLKMQNANKNIIIWANLRFSGSCADKIVSRLVAYLLNMICLNLLILYKITTRSAAKFWWKKSRIVIINDDKLGFNYFFGKLKIVLYRRFPWPTLVLGTLGKVRFP